MSACKRFVWNLIGWFLPFLAQGAKARLIKETAESLSMSAVLLDYGVDFKPRWTKSVPHPELLGVLQRSNELQRQSLRTLARHSKRLRSVPVLGAPQSSPQWDNGWLPALDAIAIYGFLAENSPNTYLEIGSGNSTKFARLAISDHGLRTKIISVDESPRAEVDGLCDTLYRSKLECTPLSILEPLRAGDLVFLDGSHRALMNSDVTVFFLEILPRLPSGVLVGVHDIFWPSDYDAHWSERAYAEQYMLGVWMLARPEMKVELAAHYVSQIEPESFQSELREVWEVLPQNIQRNGCSFWFRV